jgi:benzoate/toluate 1,2-dioxygenase beta subunit
MAKANPAPQASEDGLREVVFHEANLLDERRFEEWLDLYTQDAVYWVPAAPGQSSADDHVSLFYDDKETMVARVKRLRHPEIHAQSPASRTCRFVTNLAVDRGGDDSVTCTVTSNQLIVEYRPGWEQRIFAGRCRHTLRFRDGRWMIAGKRLDLINCDAAFAALTVPL